MKKIAMLILIALFVSSCEDNQTTAVTSSYTLDESFEVTHAATGQVSYTETHTQDLNQLITNYDDVDAVSLNSLTYTITGFSGDTSGVIQSGTIAVNNLVIATISDINPSQAFVNSTVFEINDPSIVSQIESILETTPTLNMEASVTINSGSTMTFSVAVHLDIDVTFN
ncbi:MAG: hypothetical protein JXQ93_00075 [Flavobacteriaceae bacterium]